MFGPTIKNPVPPKQPPPPPLRKSYLDALKTPASESKTQQSPQSFFDSPTFDYEGRVIRWLELEPWEEIPFNEYLEQNLSAGAQEKIRIKHAFDRIVDHIANLPDYTYTIRHASQINSEETSSYFLLSQFHFADHSYEDGAICYATSSSAGTETCFHRFFSKSELNGFLQQDLDKALHEASYPPLFPPKSLPIEREIQNFKGGSIKLSIDPYSKAIQVSDQVNQLVITIFKKPKGCNC